MKGGCHPPPEAYHSSAAPVTPKPTTAIMACLPLIAPVTSGLAFLFLGAVLVSTAFIDGLQIAAT